MRSPRSAQWGLWGLTPTARKCRQVLAPSSTCDTPRPRRVISTVFFILDVNIISKFIVSTSNSSTSHNSIQSRRRGQWRLVFTFRQQRTCEVVRIIFNKSKILVSKCDRRDQHREYNGVRPHSTTVWIERAVLNHRRQFSNPSAARPSSVALFASPIENA